jgi:hypothetical protein
MGKGSNTSTTTTTNEYDPVASAKMAEISGRQQDIAEEQWDMYKDYFQQYEIAAAETNVELLPYVSAASKATLEEQTRDIELNQPVKDLLREQQVSEIEQSAPIAEKFYKESLEGIDLGKRADEAGANVVSAMRSGRGSAGREMSRYGIDPGSSRFRSGLDETGVNAAQLIGGARNLATSEGEKENYARLNTALGVRGRATGLPGTGTTQGQDQTYFGNADPLARAQGGLQAAGSGYSSLASRVLSSTSTKETPKTSFFDFAGNVLGKAAGAYVGGL